MREVEISSAHLSTPRKAWIHSVSYSKDCLVFLDGELYIHRVKAPEFVLDATCVYVSNADAASRHEDYTCSLAYALFVAELRQWIDQNVGSFDRFFLCGLSLSGLQAVFTALTHPGSYSGVLSQSPSAWWNDEWLCGSLPAATHGHFWLSVGTLESQEDVMHPPSGMFQKASQLDSVRRLAQGMTNLGHVVHLSEYDGGHDPACWARELPIAVNWLRSC